MKLTKVNRRNRIKKRVRKKINGTASKPRLTVFRSNKSIYCQVVDDLKGNTLLSASSNDSTISGGTKTEQAKAVGKIIAEKAMAEGIKNVLFDRSGYLYHGRVKALAEGAREAGLKL